MSLADDIQSDLDIFLDPTEFGVAAVFDNTSAISVIFDDEAVVVDTTGEVISSSPQATAKESDLPDAMGKTLQVNGVTYNIIEARKDGTGMTILSLSRDSDG